MKIILLTLLIGAFIACTAKAQITATISLTYSFDGFDRIDHVLKGPQDMYWVGLRSTDRTQLAIAEFDPSTFQTIGDNIVIPIPTPSDPGAIRGMNYHDGKLVVTARTGTERYEVFLYDTATNELVWNTIAGTGLAAFNARKPIFSLDGSLVVINNSDGSNYAFNTDNGLVAWSTPPAVDTIYHGFALSTDGSLLFGANYLTSCDTQDYEPRVDAYNTATGELVDSYNHPISVPCFCPDGTRVYCNEARSPVTVDSQNLLHYVDALDGLVSVDGNNLGDLAVGSANFDPTFDVVTTSYRPLLSDNEQEIFVQATNYLASFPNPAAPVNWQSMINAYRGATLVPQDDLLIGPSDEAASGQCVGGTVGSGVTCFDLVSGEPVWEFNSEYTKSFDILSGSESLVFDDFTSNVYLLATIPGPSEAPIASPTTAPTSSTEAPTLSPGSTEAPTAMPTSMPTLEPPSATSAAMLPWQKATAVASIIIGTLFLML